MPKVKDKERILKASRDKQLVTYRGVSIRLSADFSNRGVSIRLSADFSKEMLQIEGIGKKYSKT